MLLDEPTTFLDLAHQVEVLDLLVDLNQREGRTIVLVLHDLNHACRYAHHLIAMRGGAIVAEGSPDAMVTAELIKTCSDCPARSSPTRCRSMPMVVPIGRHLHVATQQPEVEEPARRRSDRRVGAAAPRPNINDEHADWALVVGRGFGDLPDAERAIVVDLDRHGVGIVVTSAGVAAPRARSVSRGSAQLTAAAGLRCHARPEGTPALRHLRAHLIRAAGGGAGGDPHVHHERRADGWERAMSDRIMFGGGDLRTFTPVAADQFLYVLAPPPGRPRADDRRRLHLGAIRHDAPDERPIRRVLHGAPMAARRRRARPAVRPPR